MQPERHQIAKKQKQTGGNEANIRFLYPLFKSLVMKHLVYAAQDVRGILLNIKGPCHRVSTFSSLAAKHVHFTFVPTIRKWIWYIFLDAISCCSNRWSPNLSADSLKLLHLCDSLQWMSGLHCCGSVLHCRYIAKEILCTLVLQSHSMIFILLMEANGCREFVINSYVVCTVSQIEGALITLEEFVFHN